MKVLITDHIHPILNEMLTAEGMNCVEKPEITNEEVLAEIGAYEGIIISTKIQITKSLLDRANRLQFVGRAGSGMEHVDRAYAKLKGVKCFSSPEGNGNAVANHSLGLLLNLLKNISKSSEEVATGKWLREENRGVELDSLTVGVVGYGNTGSRFAKKLTGFGCGIKVYDKYLAGFGGQRIEEVSEEALRDVDVISFHVPLNSETRHWVNARFINRMAKPFFLINTSRGGIVNEEDLLAGLRNGKILGAGLDVLENEKLMTYGAEELRRFRSMNKENVIITPHIAGWSEESKRGLAEILANKIVAWMRSETI